MLSIWSSVDRKTKLNALFELQVSRGEPAHRQAIHQVERKLSGGVVAAGQREDLVGQAHFAKVVSTCLEYTGRKLLSCRAQISRARHVAVLAAASGSWRG